jgi:hypothetical protein
MVRTDAVGQGILASAKFTSASFQKNRLAIHDVIPII